MPKQIYNWSRVKAGDIISFRYKGKKSTGTLTTLLVFNPRIPYTRKDGSKTFHLVGLKLEDRGTIPMIRNKPMLVHVIETSLSLKPDNIFIIVGKYLSVIKDTLNNYGVLKYINFV